LLELLLVPIGVILGYLIRSGIARRQKSSGTIYVTHKEEKTLYSLELEEYPESIQFKKTVVFKVDSSDDSREQN
jgi:hypothetical protein